MPCPTRGGLKVGYQTHSTFGRRPQRHAPLRRSAPEDLLLGRRPAPGEVEPVPNFFRKKSKFQRPSPGLFQRPAKSCPAGSAGENSAAGLLGSQTQLARRRAHFPLLTALTVSTPLPVQFATTGAPGEMAKPRRGA